MASSRIFVKNLPPTLSEAEFRKHFSAQGREVTDVKLIPNRRIGFVGYRSDEDAARAVKYFNKSFIRMSRIAVDLAKPVSPPPPQPTPFPWAATNHACKIADSTPRPATKNGVGPGAAKPTLPKTGAPSIEPAEDANPKKRKRQPLDEADPKLQEYLEVMGHPTKKPRDDEEALGGTSQSDYASAVPPAVLEAGESDDEYEEIPSRPARTPAAHVTPAHVETPSAPLADGEPPASALPDGPAREAPQVPADATDDDWLRSRTSRLLDLVDPDDPEFPARPTPSVSAVPASEPQERSHGSPPADADGSDGSAGKGNTAENAVELIEKTSRLFLRNLSYTVTEDDIRDHFSKFGSLEEVSIVEFIV